MSFLKQKAVNRRFTILKITKKTYIQGISLSYLPRLSLYVQYKQLNFTKFEILQLTEQQKNTPKISGNRIW